MFENTFFISLIGFLILNYPYGKIFLGDTGSYFLGLLSSYLVVEVFSKNPNLKMTNC